MSQPIQPRDHAPARTAKMTAHSRGERLRRRQRVLTDQYRHEPASAMIRDRARTHAECAPGGAPLDPLHAHVELGTHAKLDMPVGVHLAVGGLSDFPVPGDMLCAALASCMDTSLRMVANALRVELAALSVEASAVVDVRGTLHVSRDVPVAFQRFHVIVALRAMPGTDPARIERMVAAAEHSCVVIQTLKRGVPVELEIDAQPSNETH